MFNGLYMDAAVNRWRHTKAADDADKARRLMKGLLLLNSISEVNIVPIDSEKAEFSRLVAVARACFKEAALLP